MRSLSRVVQVTSSCPGTSSNMPKAAKQRRKNSKALRSNPYAAPKKDADSMDVEDWMPSKIYLSASYPKPEQGLVFYEIVDTLTERTGLRKACRNGSIHRLFFYRVTKK